MTMEKYFCSTSIFSETKEGTPGKLSGYATKWNQISSDRGGYRDRFSRESFANLGQEGVNVTAYRDHNYDIYLGQLSNGSLTLRSDEVGLWFDLDLPDTTDGRDTAFLVGRKDLKGMSFGYEPDSWEWDHSGEYHVRDHVKGRLIEVSVVFDPSFQNTTVDLHSQDKAKPELFSLSESSPEALKSLEEYLQSQKPAPIRRNLLKTKLRILEAGL